jgi:hypothetical protein
MEKCFFMIKTVANNLSMLDISVKDNKNLCFITILNDLLVLFIPRDNVWELWVSSDNLLYEYVSKYVYMYVECTLTLYVNLPTFTSSVLLLTNKHFLLVEKLILVPCNINSILAY